MDKDEPKKEEWGKMVSVGDCLKTLSRQAAELGKLMPDTLAVQNISPNFN